MSSSFQVDRIFKHHRNITPDLFEIKTSLSPKTFVGSGSYGKVFRSTRTKMIMKEVPCDSIETFRHVVQEILIQAICANETKKLESNPAFASVPPILEVTVTSHEFPLKIRIVTVDAGKPLNDQPMKTKRDIARVCGAVYQVANLIEYLQKKFKFCHRDVYGNNVLVQQTKTTICSSAFKANLIDFGMARMSYRGVVLASNAYFPTSRYTPGFDMTLLLYRTFGEQCIMGLTCKDMPEDLHQAVRGMLQATGVPFGDVQSVQDLYDFIEEHGIHFKVQVSPTHVKKIMLHFAKTYCA
jgi:serine/threonine protein kinase